jgi:ketosteroid isomerase-like protein
MTLGTGTTLTQQHQDIARTVQEYIQQLNASNTRAIVDLYTDDAAFFQPDRPPAVGAQQLTDAYESAFTGIKANMTNHIDTILADGNLAAVRSHTSGSVTHLADGTVVPMSCRELWVLTRSGSHWKIAQYMMQEVQPE